jgi:hypothetical protein
VGRRPAVPRKNTTGKQARRANGKIEEFSGREGIARPRDGPCAFECAGRLSAPRDPVLDNPRAAWYKGNAHTKTGCFFESRSRALRFRRSRSLKMLIQPGRRSRQLMITKPPAPTLLQNSFRLKCSLRYRKGVLNTCAVRIERTQDPGPARAFPGGCDGRRGVRRGESTGSPPNRSRRKELSHTRH